MSLLGGERGSQWSKPKPAGTTETGVAHIQMTATVHMQLTRSGSRKTGAISGASVGRGGGAAHQVSTKEEQLCSLTNHSRIQQMMKNATG